MKTAKRTTTQPPIETGDMDGNGYLSLKTLAGYSGLSVRTLRGYLTNPLRPLPHFRVGGKILVRRLDFDRWVEQFRATSTSTTVATLVDDVVAGLR